MAGVTVFPFNFASLFPEHLGGPMSPIAVADAAVIVDAPPANPAPYGLDTAVNWLQDGGDTARWLLGGVKIRPTNIDLASGFGIWEEDWCVDPETRVDTKTGARPDLAALDVFEQLTAYAFDRNQCGDASPGSRDEVGERVRQIFRIRETLAIEHYFATKIRAVAPTALTDATDIVSAVSALEEAAGDLGIQIYIHAATKWGAYAVKDSMAKPSGATLKSPLGHTWVFGGGYKTELGDYLVATTQPLGWRAGVHTHAALDQSHNDYIEFAERSQLIGVESVIAQIEIT